MRELSEFIGDTPIIPSYPILSESDNLEFHAMYVVL